MISHYNTIVPTGGHEVIQLQYGLELANTYFIILGNHVVVIDVCSEKVVDELESRCLTPDYVILTHEHVDHLWGLNALRERFPNVIVIAHKNCSVAMGNSKANKASQYHIYATIRFGERYQNEEVRNRKYCCNPAELIFMESYGFEWKGYNFRLIHTPGHSPGSCIIFVDKTIAFTGDTVLNEKTYLKFDGGDECIYEKITMPLLGSINSNVRIFPGHGICFLMKDWREKTWVNC